ncbi:MAG TPA: hypothetical protein VGF48_09085 [Thermoanaerobaculia bacterium]|jgi:tetratricopeptide (TPR) repeat protein
MSAHALRDPIHDFVNRLAEKRSVGDFCEGRTGVGKRCLVLRTSRDVGLTFFLRHLEQTADRPWFAVYADCASSDPEIIFRRFFEKLEERKLLRWKALNAVRELGETFVRVLAPFFLPAAVASAAGSLTAAAVPKILTTAYASAASERFGNLITSGRWRNPVLFLVDNADQIKPQSLHILNTVFSDRYDHIRFVLSYVVEDGAQNTYDAFLQRLVGFGLGVDTLQFQPPDEQFVSEIAAALHVPLPADERRDLIRQSEGSISRVIGFFRADRATDEGLSNIEQEVLRFLIVAEQPLRVDDVLTLLRRTPRLMSPDSAVRRAIAALERKRLATIRKDWLGDELEIAPGQIRSVRAAVPELADMPAVQELYHYFTTVDEVRSPRHSESAYGALLYKLAKRIDPSSAPRRAFDLVRVSLAQADLEAARRYVTDATGSPSTRSVYDVYALLAFHVSVQEYHEALAALDQLGREYWERSRVLRIIHAVALNRVRAHAVSDAEIDGLLTESATTDEEFALLISYKVAGFLHEGALDAARTTFEDAYERIRAAQNRSYALRNCAAVYFWGRDRDMRRAAEVLDEALGAFREQRDSFGLFTTVNNHGALKGSTTRVEGAISALNDFQRAFDALSVFGTQHLEEVSANVGTALLLSGEIRRARTHLTKVCAIASRDFPRVLIESALAFAEAISGEVDVARERFRQLTSWVSTVNLPEASYRANVNAAAVEAMSGVAGNRFDLYVRAAANAGFWAGTSLERVITAASSALITSDSLTAFFSYDYFHYWSQNPLSVVSLPALPEQ